MASKRDFGTFLGQFWMDFGVILESSGQYVGDFLGVFFQGLFFDGFLCLRVISMSSRGVPREGL